jgi:hypothetical protein
VYRGPSTDIPDNVKSPIVLVLGWGYSKPRHLSRICSIYAKRNASTVLYIRPLWAPEFIRRYFEDDIASLIREHSANAPIIVHSFSNNGIWTYSSLCRRGILTQHDKVIIDSAPHLWYEPLTVRQEALMYTVVTLKSMSFTGLIKKFEKPLLLNTFTLLLACCHIVKCCQGLLGIIVIGDVYEMNRYIRDDLAQVPTLFIYGKGDTLVEWPFIEEFIDRWKLRNENIETLRFGDDVGHVNGLLKRPEEYAEAIDKFLLNDNSS